MKVIKPGNKIPKTYRTQCGNCEAVLEEDDVALHWEYDPRGDPPFARAKCPACNREVYFYRPR